MRRWALAVVVLLSVSACELSHVDPKATVVISGRALDASGAPLRGVQVHLYKEADIGEFLLGSLVALGSLGTVCLLPQAPAICHKGRSATTGSDGGYRFEIKGAETQGIVGDVSTLDVVFADPKGASAAASTTLRFKARTTRVLLPAARVWKAGLRVVPGGSTFGVSWRALPPSGSGTPKYTAQLLDPHSGLALWTQSATSTSARIDARVLEDHAANAAVTADLALGNDVHGLYVSARVPVQPISGAPPSRGARCSALVGTQQPKSFRQSTCGATDGDLTSSAGLTASGGGVVSGVLVDLLRARPVRFAVARGAAGPVVMEVSANGRTWRRLTTSGGSTIAAKPADRPSARFVRVRSVDGLDETAITEVSVW